MAKQVTGELYESITGQLFELGRQLRQPSGYPFDPHQLKLALQRAIEGRFNGTVSMETNPGKSFAITVDYSQSLADMIRAGKYGWVNSDITGKRFPVKGEGIVELQVEPIHLNRCISSEDAVREIERRGMRPAKIEELLVFGAKYPNEQRKHPIVALGSSAVVGGDRRVAELWDEDAVRNLNLGWWYGNWNDDSRFLALRN